MTPRTSVRAAARAHYADLTRKPASAPGTGPPAETPAAPAQDDVMAQARALYEDSAVPVRAIAAEIGVSERTIYKYAFRLGWRPRYCWADDSAAMRGRGWRAAGPFAPASGAGGRFVRREDRDEPFARGLKATDAAARVRAEEACAESARRALLAALAADCEFADRERSHAFRAMNAAMDELLRFRDENGPRRDQATERLMLEHIQAQTELVRDVRIQAEKCRASLAAARAAEAKRR